MANRASLCAFLSLSYLACHPQALQLQASNGAYISLAGRPKCGTSHLFNLLSSHPAVFSLRKEMCPGPNPFGKVSIDESLFAKFLDFTVSHASAEDGSWLRMEKKEMEEACEKKFGTPDECKHFFRDALSGGSGNGTKVLQSCVHHPDVVAHMQKLVPVPNPKVLFLQRDPADMMWSAYNFWSTQMDAPHTVVNPNNSPEPWTNSKNFRSPKHFHELVVSEGRLVGGVSDWAEYMMIPHMHKLKNEFGRDRVFFLRSEDMHLRDTVQSICDFVGLDIDGIPHQLIGEKTNSQGSLDDRGVDNANEAEQPGRYEVSGYQPMLDETRALIYKQSRHSCSELDREFGVKYPECLGAA